MRARVLTYKSDGNTVVERYMELQPLNENIFYSLASENEINELWDEFYFIFKIQGVYFVFERKCRRHIKDASYLSYLQEECYKYWMQNVLQSAENEKYINLLTIAVFERLGLDAAPLYQSRAKAMQRIKEEEEEERRQILAEELRIKKEEEEQHKQKLQVAKQLFLNGQGIDGATFVEIAKSDGFEIHLRTQGTMRKSVSQLDKTGVRRYYKEKGKRMPSFDGCNKVIKEYYELICKQEN